MKLTGWYRMGIVLSAICCLIVIGLTIYQYNFSPTHKGILVTWEYDKTKPIDTIIVPRAPCIKGINCEEGDMEYSKPKPSLVIYDTKNVVNYKGVLGSIIVPIVVVLLLILSIKWIKRGFKSVHPKE